MSKYETYDQTSKNYDKSRKAIGLEIILGYLSSLPVPINEQTVLDAGCGTGNYAVALYPKVSHITCMDICSGMLECAEKKFQNKGFTNVNFIKGDLSEMDFPPESFDLVMCNQSLHHLDEPDTEFKNQREFFRRVHSVLKPHGIIIISTILHEQLKDGVWWGEIIKPAVDRMTKRFTSYKEISSLLNRCGFNLTGRVVPVHSIIQEDGYFDPLSLKREEFRAGDSHFSLLTQDELEKVIREIDGLIRERRIKSYMQERDELRQRIGQVTFFVAEKAI